METLGWLFYGLFLIAPVVAAGLLVLGAVVVLCWIGFRIHRKVGLTVAGLIAIGAGGVAHEYMFRGPAAFNAACDSGTGIAVYDTARADSYVLRYGPSFAHKNRYLHVTDATIGAAILNVAYQKVQYVEIEDWVDPKYGSHLEGDLATFRPTSATAGFFRVYVAARGSAQCRWLMPEDVESIDYPVYIGFGRIHRRNDKVAIPEQGKSCVAVAYTLSPQSRYSVEFSLREKINEWVYKHEIRVVDRHENVIVGTDVAYEYARDSGFESMAFWLGNGRRHDTCPMNLLQGLPLVTILGLRLR